MTLAALTFGAVGAVGAVGALSACSSSHGAGGDDGSGSNIDDVGAPCTTDAECQSGECVPDALGSGATYSCTGPCYGLSSQAGSAVCAAGGASCFPGWVHWEPTPGATEYCACDVVSAEDLCNGIDDNCNGVVDEDGDAQCAAAIPGEGCQAAQCVWCPARCGSACDDLAFDVSNCMACGNQCPAGTATSDPACSTAGCTTLDILEPGPSYYAAIAADGSAVYFFDYDVGELLSCPTTGCAGDPTVLATGVGYVQSLVQDQATLYWVDQFGVVGCAKSGCGTPTVLAAGDDTYEAVAVSGSTLVLALAGTSNTDGEIVTCPTTGCAASPPAIATGLAYPVQVQVAGDTAYFATSPQGSDEQVFSCALAGCGASPTLVYTATGPVVFTVASGAIYFEGYVDTIAQHQAFLYSCPAPGPCTSPTQVAFLPYAAQPLASDATNVYWLGALGDTYDGVIESCPLGACSAPTVLAGSISGAEAFAVTPDAIYISTSNSVTADGGKIYRLAR